MIAGKTTCACGLAGTFVDDPANCCPGLGIENSMCCAPNGQVVENEYACCTGYGKQTGFRSFACDCAPLGTFPPFGDPANCCSGAVDTDGMCTSAP